MAATWLVVACVVALCEASFVFPSSEDDITEVRTRQVPRPNQASDTVELPDNLQQLDFNHLTHLNNISSIEDFAQLFDLELPTNEDNAELTVGIRSGGAPAVTADNAQMANCKPELRTVELQLPVQDHTTFYPTCVRLERCGGCCFGPLLECTPTRTQFVKLKVLKSSVSLPGQGSRPQQGDRRRRGNRAQSYHIVNEVRHMACECGCKVKAEDCNDTIHNYNESECTCVCKDSDKKRKCEEQANTMYWSDETCSCLCRNPPTCGNGEFINQNTCRCELVR